MNQPTVMKALVFHGPNKLMLEDRPKPKIIEATDAIVRITTTSICGTDLHILKGDVPTIAAGRILGHEGVGIIDEVGPNVLGFRNGDKVLISLITSCGRCSFCKKAMNSHCLNGGWLLGNSIDGTQAEYVRVPFADTGLYMLPPDADDEAAVMLSCSLPTGLECGALCGQVKPGDIVAIEAAVYHRPSTSVRAHRRKKTREPPIQFFRNYEGVRHLRERCKTARGESGDQNVNG